MRVPPERALQFRAMYRCAAAILTDAEGRVLLLWQPRGTYGLPGGVVEPGETPPQAAVREAREEIGVEIGLEHLIGTYYLRGGGKVDMVNSVYKARVISGTPHVADKNEVLRLEWFAPGALPTPINNDARVAVPDFWAGRRGVVRRVVRS